MTISQLFDNIGQALAVPQPHAELAGLTADSRQVRPGYAFVAYKGVAADGHDYIGRAIEAGASAIACESLPESLDPRVAWIKLADAQQALGLLASRWYGCPSERLTLVGVTGTNGKTTIATLLYEMARLTGRKAGLLSTVANKIDGETVPATHTTPDPLALNALLARMVEAGCEFCAMEVSSHAADQKRIAGLRFAGGIFTNLTRDHLDYHKTVARYLAAKKSFFDALPADAFALANADDRNGEVMMQNTRARRYTYALRSAATFRCRVIEDRLDGMLLALQGEPDGMLGQPAEVVTKFTGRFNAYNLAAVYGAAQLLGLDRGEALRLLSELHPVDGRMQRLMSPSGICAIVDYAHTPDALANALAALRQSATGRIITVTGAGGDRDKGKRPLMGAEAAKASDLLVITSDNPRHEDPADIAAEILAGVPDPSRAVTILDRAEAIAYAIGQARPGDAVLIAGKGHEDYQQIGDEKRHFDDREAVAAAFANLSNTKSPK